MWVLAFRSRDLGGRWSETDTRIVASLGDQRLGDALVWECPAATGWPGTLVGAARSADGRDALEAVPSYAWSAIPTWRAWRTWGLGTGDDGARAMSYTTEPYDVGIGSIDYTPRWSASSTGTVTAQVRTGATRAACLAASWAAIGTAPVRGRWVQLRWTLAGDGTVQLSLDHLCWSLHAPTSRTTYHDTRIDSFAAVSGAPEQRVIPRGRPDLRHRRPGHPPGRRRRRDLEGGPQAPRRPRRLLHRLLPSPRRHPRRRRDPRHTLAHLSTARSAQAGFA